MSRLSSPMQTNPLMSQLPSPRTCRWLSWWASYFLWILTLHRCLACWVSCSLLRQKAHWMSWRQSTWLYVHLYKAQNSLAELTVIHSANCTLYKARSSLVELTVIHMAICTGEKLTCWASWFLEAGWWVFELPIQKSILPDPPCSSPIRSGPKLFSYSIPAYGKDTLLKADICTMWVRLHQMTSLNHCLLAICLGVSAPISLESGTMTQDYALSL